VPIEQALSNGRPTVLEFYADWCEVCRETAPNVMDVERSLKDRVNFVMLNVDNAKARRARAPAQRACVPATARPAR
jgi:thiol-disulfide isomerase/thioredoxin